MKFKPTVLLAAFVVALGLLLGTNVAQAAEVILDGDGNVTQILNLPVTDEVTTTVYNVEFKYATAEEVYGPDFEFDFPPPGELILVALNAVNNALNSNDPIPMGAGPEGTRDYFIGHVKEIFDIVVAAGGERIAGNWERCKGEQCLNPGNINTGFAILGPNDTVTFADFIETTGPPPDPVTIGGTVTGLEGSGLVLQNNESDDEPIAADGEFTFDTPQTPGTSYNVSVKTQPRNPAQTCNVENGSGLVPTVDVTTVAVTCAKPVFGDLVKVAEEGDSLPDSTVLTDILLDGGVAINWNGQVAFGGRDGNGTDAVFTQSGRVVKEGDILDDGTLLAAFRGQGQVGINASQNQTGNKVAFHGQADAGENDTTAVFTQAGKVAAVGDILSEGISLKDIAPEGKVAINNADQVAFHGSVAVADGFSDKRFRVVLIADEVDTWIDVREGSKLPDGTPLDDITESGGISINDLDVVAFHGLTVNTERGDDALKAVFTSWGLVAREGTDLPDGTILDDINENGGVAINLLSKVAFHGQTVVPDRGGDALKAVFIADEGDIRVVAKVGDVLPDGSRLDDIAVSGGVTINLYDDVVFHGQTGGVKAVFNQNGVIAKVGDIVNDGSTLEEINTSAGVAVNPYGREAAFHGRINSADAVFVSLTPTPNAKPVADFTYETDNITANFADLSRDLDGDVVAWSWDFGDGSTSTEQNPSYTYASAGTYTVSLTVEDDQGGVSEPAEDLVEVSEPHSGNVVQVFVTDTTYFGDIGGLAGADAECQARAERAGLTGTWTAWLSTTDVDPPGPGGIIEGVDARDRIPDGQYQLVDGTVIAEDKADLTDGSLNAPINLDQFGNPPSAGVVWTGTNLRGTFSGTNCSNWTNAGGSTRCAEGDDDCGDRGISSMTTPQWTRVSGAPTSCNSFFHLYCFGGGE